MEAAVVQRSKSSNCRVCSLFSPELGNDSDCKASLINHSPIIFNLCRLYYAMCFCNFTSYLCILLWFLYIINLLLQDVCSVVVGHLFISDKESVLVT